MLKFATLWLMVGAYCHPLLGQGDEPSTFTLPGVANDNPAFIPEPCCNTLQNLINSASETVIQVMVDGDAIYTLTQVADDNANQQYTYGALTKTDLNGFPVWRTRTQARWEVTSFTRDTAGNFLITGGEFDRSLNQSITAPGDNGESSSATSTGDQTNTFQKASSDEVAYGPAFVLKLDAAGVHIEGQRYNRLNFNGITPKNDQYAYFYALADYPSRIDPTSLNRSKEYSIVDVYRVDENLEVEAIHRLSPDRSGPLDVKGNMLVVESFPGAGGKWIIAADYDYTASAGSRSTLTVYDEPNKTATGYFLPPGHRMNAAKPLDDRVIAVAATDESGSASEAKLFLIENGKTIINEVTWTGSERVDRWTDIDVRKSGSSYDLVLSGIMSTEQAVVQKVTVTGSTYSVAIGEAGLIKDRSGNQVLSSALEISPDGNTIAYADARSSDGGINSKALIGNVNSSLEGKCTATFDPSATSDDKRTDLESYAITVTNAPNNPYSKDDSYQVEVAVLDNCNYELVDACTEPYPTQTGRLIELARPADCDDDQDVAVVVTNSLGVEVVSTQIFRGGAPIKVNLTDQRVGTYYIRISATDAGGELLHVASVRVI